MSFFGCDHKWEIIARTKAHEVTIGSEAKQPCTIYHLQCVHCGRVKEDILMGWAADEPK